MISNGNRFSETQHRMQYEGDCYIENISHRKTTTNANGVTAREDIQRNQQCISQFPLLSLQLLPLERIIKLNDNNLQTM